MALLRKTQNKKSTECIFSQLLHMEHRTHDTSLWNIWSGSRISRKMERQPQRGTSLLIWHNFCQEIHEKKLTEGDPPLNVDAKSHCHKNISHEVWYLSIEFYQISKLRKSMAASVTDIIWCCRNIARFLSSFVIQGSSETIITPQNLH